MPQRKLISTGCYLEQRTTRRPQLDMIDNISVVNICVDK
jgi:hypothetical protein